MQIVLAIEPDLRQAAIIKRIVRDKVLADVVVVETRDAALEAIRKEIPDVLLLSALLSPRDEDELIAHLRLLDGAEHLQTHTIPQLAGTSADREGGRSRGLFGIFGKKKEKEDASAAGCDPDLFAEEIRTYLQRAHEKKEERKFLLEQGIEIDTPGAVASPQARQADAPPAQPSDDAGSSSSSWSSPFEWRPKSAGTAPPPEAVVADADAEPVHHGHAFVEPEPSIVRDEPSILRDEPPVIAAEPTTVPAETHAETPERAYEPTPAPPYESVIVQQPIAPEPEPVFNREPIAAKPADPWAVEYGGGHQVVPPEPSMVGYTAPFADAPVEPIGLSKSAMSPDIEPLDQLAEPAEQGIDTSYEPLLHTGSAQEEEEEESPLVMRTRTDDEDLARVSDALDLQVDDTPESASEDLSLDAEQPVLEISARDVLPERESHAISIEDVPEEAWQSDRAPRETEEPAPVAASPSTRRSTSGSSRSVLRLMPLAIWARAEMDKPGKPAATDEEAAPRSVNDELRDLMSRLALPPNIAGVSYARGVRIRRVRVQGGGERPTDDKGPVILSKRALDARRQANT